MSNASCTTMPSKVRQFFFRNARQAEGGGLKAKRTDFQKAAMLAASGYYAEEDYESGSGVMDVDAVN